MGSSLISSFLEIDFEINISDKKSRRFDLKTQNTKPQNTRRLRREDGWVLVSEQGCWMRFEYRTGQQALH